MASDSITRSFAELVRRRRAAPLVASPTRSWTVGEVDERAAALARRLERWGVAPGHVVALAARNGAGFLCALLAVRRRGAIALLPDASLPPRRLAAVVRRMAAVGSLRCGSAWPGADELGWEPSPRDAAQLDPGIAAIKLTSGSSGSPLGVLTPGSALVADDRALAATMGLRGPEERIVAAIPMSHSYGLSSVVLPALVRGSLLILPEDRGPFAALRAAAALEATFLPTVPAYLQALLRASDAGRLPASLRLVVSAGAPLPPEVAAEFRRRHGRAVHVFYGASECGGITFDRDGSAGLRGTVGTPVEGVELELVRGPEAGTGEHARLAVRSPAVAAGYWPRPSPRLAGGRFLSDDLVELRRGEVVLLGRVRELVNVRGKKVDPREVERVIARLPGVDEVAVLGVPSPNGGSEVLRAVVASRSPRVSGAALRRWCRERLADHAVPRSVAVVEELPRTARGKLDRAALLEVREGALGRGE